MKLLLDTHIWLWISVEADRLAPRIGKVLADPKNELWLSPVSIWELTVLCRQGRFRTAPDIPTWVAKTMRELYLIEAPLTVAVTLALPSMKFTHGDPADHLLAATAKVFDLTLVTADEQLSKLGEIDVLMNR
jgi:PIN domain nuclease of toxin-antitoxin system